MAKTSPTSLDLEALRVSRAVLDQRWDALSDVFREALSLTSKTLLVSSDYQAGGVWAGFHGRGCERIRRNRGNDVFVAPLLPINKKLHSWIGFQEIWDVREGKKPFEFRQLGLTVHFGFFGDPVKPQIFRAEWMGVQDWNGKGTEFHSHGAGHPHWQIDALESFKGLKINPTFEADDNPQVEEFKPIEELPIDDLVKRVTIERMHFASAAPWWSSSDQSPYPAHLNAPTSVAELTRWIMNCVEYIKQEIQRCELQA